MARLASSRARRCNASARSWRPRAMSVSVTPIARGIRPAMRPEPVCRLDPAALCPTVDSGRGSPPQGRRRHRATELPRALARSLPRRDRAPQRLGQLRAVGRRQGFGGSPRGVLVRVLSGPATPRGDAVEPLGPRSRTRRPGPGSPPPGVVPSRCSRARRGPHLGSPTRRRARLERSVVRSEVRDR